MARDDYDRAYWKKRVQDRLIEQGRPDGKLPRDILERIGRELGPFLARRPQ